MRRNRAIGTNSTDRDIRAETRRDQAIPNVDARRIAEQARQQWRRHELEDVSAILKSYPELLKHRTIVIELAYEEYVQRQQSGSAPGMREFANRFPGFETSLYLFLNVQSLLGDAELLDEDLWPQSGDSFQGFAIHDELGRGAFARVFLASENALGDRLVALKVAQHGGPEAMILGRLDHANIVPIHSVWQDSRSGVTAVCMPYLGRATLTDLLDESFSGGHSPRNAESAFGFVRSLDNENHDTPARKFSRAKGSYEDEIVRLGIQLADALTHSHQRGIYHRDIKPSNVLLAFDGRPLLLDFNLSINDREWLDRVGGTLPYMAPEDLVLVLADDGEKETQRADPRSDIFSLGVILYQLLTGRLPFEPEEWTPSTAQTAAKILIRQRETLDSIRRANRGVTTQLEEVIFDCLKYDPDDRIQTAKKLTNRLRRYFRPAARVKRWIWRHPWRVTVASTLMVLALTCWGSYLALRPPYPERMLATGIEHYENGEFDAALNDLNEAVRYGQDSVEPLMARGKVHLAREEYESAFASFNAARKLSNSPTACSASGYCASQLNHHESALLRYSQAYDKGDRSVALLNNMAYSLLQQNKLPEAEQFLKLALEVDPTHPVVCQNLLYVHLRRSVSNGAVSKDALLAADRATEHASPSFGLYYELATLYAVAATNDQSHASTSMQWLGLAVENGMHSAKLSDPVFSVLHELPEYEVMITKAEPTTEPRSPQRLISPF